MRVNVTEPALTVPPGLLTFALTETVWLDSLNVAEVLLPLSAVVVVAVPMVVVYGLVRWPPPARGTFRSNDTEPTPVGVPEMTKLLLVVVMLPAVSPVPLSEKLATLSDGYGAVPLLTVTVWLYGVPKLPEGNVPGAKVGSTFTVSVI